MSDAPRPSPDAPAPRGLARPRVVLWAGLALAIACLPLDAIVLDAADALRAAATARSGFGNLVFEQVMQAYGRIEGVLASALLVLWLGRGGARARQRVRTLLLAAVLVGAGVGVAKGFVGRARPGLTMLGSGHYETWIEGPLLGVFDPQYRSWPSGHTAAAVSNAVLMARFHPALAPLVAGLAVCVGVQRVYSAKHFPSDVVGGAVLGWLGATLTLRRREAGRWRLPLERESAGTEGTT